MTVRGGCHQLTGMVSLGHFHGAMENIKSGKNITTLLVNNTRSLWPLMVHIYIKPRLCTVLILFRSVTCRSGNTPSAVYLPK